MHTEPEIRRAIKPIIEKYGQLNTTELKAILSEYIEYDEEDLQESDTRNGETLIEQRIRNIVSHARSEDYVYPEGFKVNKTVKPTLFTAITGLSANLKEISISEITKRRKSVKKNDKKRKIYNKIDWTLENERRTELGTKGEIFVYEREKQTVAEFDETAINRVIHLSAKQGDVFGYDIESVNKTGETIFIEVKTTTGAVETPFYMSVNEKSFFEENISNNAYIYRVYNFNPETSHGQIKIISAKELLENYNFDPISFIVTPK